LGRKGRGSAQLLKGGGACPFTEEAIQDARSDQENTRKDLDLVKDDDAADFARAKFEHFSGKMLKGSARGCPYRAKERTRNSPCWRRLLLEELKEKADLRREKGVT